MLKSEFHFIANITFKYTLMIASNVNNYDPNGGVVFLSHINFITLFHISYISKQQ